MSERESFGDYVNLRVRTFKEDAEKGLNHMKGVMQLSEPPFSRDKKDDREDNTIMAMEDEAESSMRL